MNTTRAPKTGLPTLLSPLTVRELETLAALIDSGTRKMTSARDREGAYAWPGTSAAEAAAESLAAFYDIRNVTSRMVADPPRVMAWEVPEGQVFI